MPMIKNLPVLPLRDIVVFPDMVAPLFVGRDKSVRALEEVMKEDKQILLAAQIDPSEDDPTTDGIYAAGVLANVLQDISFSALPGNRVEIVLTLEEPVSDPVSFSTDNPARIAIDLPDTTSALTAKTKAISVGAAQAARVWLDGSEVLTTPHPLERTSSRCRTRSPGTSPACWAWWGSTQIR